MQSICSFIFQTVAKQSKGAGNRFPAGVCMGKAPSLPLNGLHRNPSALSLLQTVAKRRKGAGNKFPVGACMGKAPSLPLNGLHRNPSLSPLLQTAAKRKWESEGQLSLRRGLGRQPHRSPPSPRHSMRTFRPSIIAARALRENASNCLSVMCSIRLSGFTEPAAVVLAVGTP